LLAARHGIDLVEVRVGKAGRTNDDVHTVVKRAQNVRSGAVGFGVFDKHIAWRGHGVRCRGVDRCREVRVGQHLAEVLSSVPA
jgi:hypothetical protein